MVQPATKKKPPHTPEEKRALGELLRKARKAAGFSSVDAVAEALCALGYDVTRSAVGHWETGKNLTDPIWLRRLARLYRTSVDGLVSSDTRAWPFSAELYEKVATLGVAEIEWLEHAMWTHLRVPIPEAVQSGAASRQRLRSLGAGVQDSTVARKAIRNT